MQQGQRLGVALLLGQQLGEIVERVGILRLAPQHLAELRLGFGAAAETGLQLRQVSAVGQGLRRCGDGRLDLADSLFRAALLRQAEAEQVMGVGEVGCEAERLAVARLGGRPVAGAVVCQPGFEPLPCRGSLLSDCAMASPCARRPRVDSLRRGDESPAGAAPAVMESSY